MAAAVYSGILRFQCAGSGRRFEKFFSASDANTEYWLENAVAAASGGSEFIMPIGEGNIMLYDIMLASDATDCRQVNVFANGKNVQVAIRTTDNLISVVSRQFSHAPLLFAEGAHLQFQQVTNAL